MLVHEYVFLKWAIAEGRRSWVRPSPCVPDGIRHIEFSVPSEREDRDDVYDAVLDDCLNQVREAGPLTVVLLRLRRLFRYNELPRMHEMIQRLRDAGVRVIAPTDPELYAFLRSRSAVHFDEYFGLGVGG